MKRNKTSRKKSAEDEEKGNNIFMGISIYLMHSVYYLRAGLIKRRNWNLLANVDFSAKPHHIVRGWSFPTIKWFQYFRSFFLAIFFSKISDKPMRLIDAAINQSAEKKTSKRGNSFSDSIWFPAVLVWWHWSDVRSAHVRLYHIKIGANPKFSVSKGNKHWLHWKF